MRLNEPHLLAVLRYGALAAAVGGLTGCGASEVSCSLVANAAVVVTVVDASGGAVCDVTVHIQGGDVDVQKDLTTDACSAVAGEQPGDYAISVSRAGSSLAEEQVHVDSGKCGVVQEQVVVRLPAP